MQPVPCPLCGYDAPEAFCRHCGLAAADPSLAAPSPSPLRGVADGGLAIFRGFLLLATTSGVKRFLIPPLVLTLGLFVAVFAWIWARIEALIEAVDDRDVTELDIPWEWLETAVTWLIQRGVVVWLLHMGGWALFLISSTVVALWTFSIAYEAISGPFLDEIQGRIEKRWFGRDPRNALERPNAIPVKRCVVLSLAAGAVAAACGVLWWNLDGWPAWSVLAGAPLAFVAAGLHDREYGEWLWWVVRLEAHTTWVGVKASLLAGLLMVLFFWLKFVPVVGYFLFAGLAGFATAISLLDIPFSRRQWALAQRFQFLVKNPLPTLAYGLVASLFFLVPFLGPLLAVPAASIGGMWLVCRLDKNAMRPAGQRLARPGARPGDRPLP